jgi:molybdate transport system substrate-binding protein
MDPRRHGQQASALGPAPFALAVLLVSLNTLAAGCAASPREDEFIIAAASSLTGAFRELGTAYEEERQAQVILTFGATGHLAEHLRNGAPYDLFASADAAHIQVLIEQGLLSSVNRRTFAHGSLVLAWNESHVKEQPALLELTDPRLSRVAIANPAHAPYGQAAIQALQSAGLWPDVEAKVIYAETVRQAAEFVETGNAPVGILALSTAIDSSLPYLYLDPDLHEPMQHVIGIRSGQEKAPLVLAFLRFLETPTAAQVLRRSGFDPSGGN